MDKGLWYAFRETAPKTFGVAAFDPLEIQPVKQYEIAGNYCSCPAHVPFCKHLRMLKVLKESGGVVGRFINDETDEILQPLAAGPVPLG